MILMGIIKKHPFLAVFLVFYTTLIAYKLIATPAPFYDWDESIYMQVGKEMINAKSFTPLWQGQLWFEKPPLAPFIYGLLNALPFMPEISTRIFSLALSLIALCLIYIWVQKISRNKLISTLTIVLTAFNPIFLQRTQTVNTDIFLLIGWLGYMLVFPRFWLSLLFLFLGVFSKSVLGFYPLLLILFFNTYKYLKKEINRKSFLKLRKIFFRQTAILSVWYIIMFGFYGNDFLRTHFGDHLLRRVTSSIESHFGQRTFYVDVIVEQYGYYLLAALLGLILFLKNSKKDVEKIILGLLFIPWFIFLNLSKTKIAWYLYLFVPQIAFLISYSLSILNRNGKPVRIIMPVIAIVLFYNLVVPGNFFKTFYSKYDENYRLAKFAKDKCNSINFLLSKNSRETFKVLGSMNLLISTSKFYGSNPSIVYYSGKKVNWLYNKAEAENAIKSLSGTACLAIQKDDLDIIKGNLDLELMTTFGQIYLYQKK